MLSLLVHFDLKKQLILYAGESIGIAGVLIYNIEDNIFSWKNRGWLLYLLL